MLMLLRTITALLKAERRPLDELPLNWFFADAVVLELTHKRDNEHIDIRDLEIGLAEINYVLKPLDIVLLRTGRNQFYGQPDYSSHGWR